ncbi:penicillin-binding protein [Rosettibacter firmus]|uniref:penicillin-binding protein n=1 Tax=Rosettibacter firmus TaxID=3111522 RepID=UPI00336BF08F
MINYRALIILGFSFLFFIALLIRLYSIQIINNEYYLLKAQAQQIKPRIVKAERGMIKDRNGEILCFTRDFFSFYVDTRMMNSNRVDTIAKEFSRVFRKSESYYKKIIENGIRNICIEKKVPVEKALHLKKLIVDGFFYEEDFSRVYPYGKLASHVLGYVDREFKGVSGLEKVFDKKLAGIDGNFVFQRDVLGRIVSIDEKKSKAPKPGNNLILTINKTYQSILEDELSKGLQKYEGESAVGIIMNPNTGEILALANIPDYDPNNYKDYPIDAMRNRAITDTYEPGSTIKSIVFSILFDLNLVKENEIINTENGKYIFRNIRISDSHPYTSLTVKEILEQSSNIGMTKLSTKIPDEIFYKYLRDFGFGNYTSIELPGEAEGTLKRPINFTPYTKAFMSFGYEFSVTPLQIITAYSALINGGKLLKPYIVKAITDEKDSLIEEYKPQVIRNVIRKETSDLMRNLLVGVVENGTGKEAQLDNVLVGGKTGTSQKLVDGSYTSSKHNSSFVGFFPADNPQLICLILVNAPKVGKYGGLVAAPIFKNVAQRILDADLSLAPLRKKINRKNILIDRLITKTNSENYDTKSFMNISESKTKHKEKRRILIENKNVMPNLINHSLRDAIAILNELGVKYKITGIGKIVSQSIEPGTPINHNSICYLQCAINKKVNVIKSN